MSHRYDVIVIGELNADLILSGEVTPAFGQVEKLIDEATLTIGSSSAICACGLARLGLRVAFMGIVGEDEFGRFMVRELAAHGVDTAYITVDPSLKTGLSVILSRGVDRAILTYSGSIAALRYEMLAIAALAHARHVHLGSYYLLDNLRPAVPRLLAEAKARGLTVSLDTNYDPTEQWAGGLAEALHHVDVFLPNEAELQAITGLNNLPAALNALTVPTVAVKLGARGAIARRGVEVAHAEIVPVRVADTTGAGDSFDAGFIYGYLAGWDLPRTLRLAAVCGSLSTRAVGGTAAQATLAEALAHLS